MGSHSTSNHLSCDCAATCAALAANSCRTWQPRHRGARRQKSTNSAPSSTPRRDSRASDSARQGAIRCRRSGQNAVRVDCKLQRAHPLCAVAERLYDSIQTQPHHSLSPTARQIYEYRIHQAKRESALDFPQQQYFQSIQRFLIEMAESSSRGISISCRFETALYTSITSRALNPKSRSRSS